MVRKIINDVYDLKDASLFFVALFVGAWLFIGNFWSIVSTYRPVNISSGITILSAIIYLIVAIPVIIFFFIELFRLKSKIKWFIAAEVIVFFAFVIAPPRNADAMRVWLAKVYDVWMHGKKIIRPYWHYNTPDAFTLFHLPLINLWDGQVFQMSIFTAVCALCILLIRIGRIYAGSDKIILLALGLVLFNPLIILASTTVVTDIPMILAVAGVFYGMIRYEQRKESASLLLIILFFAYGANIKYNMLMFAPALVYWWIRRARRDAFDAKAALAALVLAGVAAMPYLMNYINFSNPVWPALVQYFPGSNQFMNEFANSINEGFAGKRTVMSFFDSFAHLFLIPHHINPLVMVTIFFIFQKDKHTGYMPAVLVVSYLFILWLMLPEFGYSEKERYVEYLFPIIAPLGVYNAHNIIVKQKYAETIKRVLTGGIIAAAALYLSFTILYSKDTFGYLLTHDKNHWHRATWYYSDYDWINKNIQLDKRDNILVYTCMQQTYYLRKPYVNADTLSGLVNWKSFSGLEVVKTELQKYNIKYIYVDNDFIEYETPAKEAINLLYENGVIERVWVHRLLQYSSRMRNIYQEHETILYRVKGI
jgi:hypothetical protein